MSRRDVLLAAPVVAMATLAIRPPIDGGLSLCPVAFFTGFACPGCGMTRAVSHLMHGDMAMAVTLHPLVIPILAVGAVLWVWFLLWRLGRLRPIGRGAFNAIIASSAVALVTVWVTRLASGTLPPV
ncbi:MAG: DUF2752 domain-containing protein [Actinobacteria bacterium]|nr:DUF2752 domain-containing protein [Actinomycetota bacterium]